MYANPVITRALTTQHRFLERRRIRTIQNLSAEMPSDLKAFEHVSPN